MTMKLGCAAALLVVAAGVFASPVASAYPDTSGYQHDRNLRKFAAVDHDGVWLTTPLGLRCGMDPSGGYGCSGELPGAPPGVNEVAWFPGDPSPRLYPTDTPHFDSGRAQTILFMRQYIEYRGSRCAIDHEAAVYCIHGDDPNSQIMVTATTVVSGTRG